MACGGSSCEGAGRAGCDAARNAGCAGARDYRLRLLVQMLLRKPVALVY